MIKHFEKIKAHIVKANKTHCTTISVRKILLCCKYYLNCCKMLNMGGKKMAERLEI
jgi:hypothetical protein